MIDLKGLKPRTPEYRRAQYENMREKFNARIDVVRTARYLTHGDMPTLEGLARALGMESWTLMVRLARRDVPDEVADYCGVPSLYLRNRSSLLRWIRANI